MDKLVLKPHISLYPFRFIYIMVQITRHKMSGSVWVYSGALIGCDCWRSLQREDLGNIESDFSLDTNTNRNFSFNCTTIEHNINWTMSNSIMINIKIHCCPNKAGRTIHRHFGIMISESWQWSLTYLHQWSGRPGKALWDPWCNGSLDTESVSLETENWELIKS